MKTIQPKLGEGIFLIKDVAEILRLPYPKVRHWIVELWDNKFGSNFSYAFGEKGNKAINFLTLIEFYTYFQLREQKVPLREILKAHSTIAKDLNVKHPFATSLQVKGKRIWYEHLDYLVKADGKQQFDIKSFLEGFLHRIDFGKSHIAERYFPLDNAKNVVVDPKHQFGQPTILGTNITTEFIYKLFKGGETKENICILYELNEQQINDAILYQKQVA
jgi:uncharacterized protein (DUF433 family)